MEKNQKKLKNDIFLNEKINYSYGNVDKYLNPNIKLDDDYIFLSGDPNLFCLDEISSDVNYSPFLNNIKSPFFNFTSNCLS